jgi:hypothetical protein
MLKLHLVLVLVLSGSRGAASCGRCVSVRPAVAIKRRDARCVSSPVSLVPASRHNSLSWIIAHPIEGAITHNDFGRCLRDREITG